jgi:transcription antitermination factor NusG
MPLLPKEEEVFPSALFELEPAAYPWGVAHVRSRQEKSLARFLAQRDVPFYLPQIENRRRRSGRDFVSHLPLFPGYVFFRGGAEVRELVWRSNVAASVIDVADQRRIGDELAQLRELQLAGASLRVVEELVAGDAVRVSEGAFAGYTGVVERGKGRDRLIVRVSLIHKAIAVEFERELLTRVGRVL